MTKFLCRVCRRHRSPERWRICPRCRARYLDDGVIDFLRLTKS